jgi:hypothetical protein
MALMFFFYHMQKNGIFVSYTEFIVRENVFFTYTAILNLNGEFKII